MPAKSGLTIIDRFWSKVKTGRGCWGYLGCLNEHGYGIFGISPDVSVLAHRFAWEITHKLPAGKLFVCHHCDNPTCVRPDHLFLGTARENVHDCIRKNRANKAHPLVCKRGHPFSGDNLIVMADSERRCRLCSRLRVRERYRKAHNVPASKFRNRTPVFNLSNLESK